MSSEAKAGVPPAAFMQRLLDEQRLALKTAENKLRELDQIEVNYLQLKERLTTLPTRLRHPVTVPLNSVGFFLGDLIHTNEITVLLSSEILVQVAAPTALEILHKRVGECRARQEKTREEIRHIGEWSKFTAAEAATGDKEGAVDINEEFDEEKEARWRAQHAERLRADRARQRREEREAANQTDEATLWERLEELEMEEELASYADRKRGQGHSEGQGHSRESATAEVPLRLSEEAASRDIVVNRSTIVQASSKTKIIKEDSSAETVPKGILKRRPSDGALKSVHFLGQRLEQDQSSILDSDDDEEPAAESDDLEEEDAFTGVVLERNADTGKVIEPVEVPGQARKVSRFKASRM